jgi:hypothetical protein
MRKLLSRIITIVIAIAFVVFLYVGHDMYQFGRGVGKDAEKGDSIRKAGCSLDIPRIIPAATLDSIMRKQ